MRRPSGLALIPKPKAAGRIWPNKRRKKKAGREDGIGPFASSALERVQPAGLHGQPLSSHDAATSSKTEDQPPNGALPETGWPPDTPRITREKLLEED